MKYLKWYLHTAILVTTAFLRVAWRGLTLGACGLHRNEEAQGTGGDRAFLLTGFGSHLPPSFISD